MRIIGVIPARFASTRFPGKPLAVIKGRSLIERVWRQAQKCRDLDGVVIATDNERIRAAAENFGARVIMTRRSCKSGTDRLAEIALRHEKKTGAFINIQGDEPLISPALIDTIARELRKKDAASVVTAACPLRSPADSENPNIVKVVTGETGLALYFSRSAIPYDRAGRKPGYLKHLGIYGFRRAALISFSKWRQTPLEKTEMLEQLRLLEKGVSIKVLVTRHESVGVDVPADLRKIERLLK